MWPIYFWLVEAKNRPVTVSIHLICKGAAESRVWYIKEKAGLVSTLSCLALPLFATIALMRTGKGLEAEKQ